MGWAVTRKKVGAWTRQKRGRGIAHEKGRAKPIDNFLTQSRVKERNEKYQKRKKERED